jgi:hypothetical protein
MRILKRKNCFHDTKRFGLPEIRVFHKPGKGKRSPRYLLKCGDCEAKLEIYYDECGLEISGVNGAIEDWREILLPLLLSNAERGKLEVRGGKIRGKNRDLRGKLGL